MNPPPTDHCGEPFPGLQCQYSCQEDEKATELAVQPTGQTTLRATLQIPCPNHRYKLDGFHAYYT